MTGPEEVEETVKSVDYLRLTRDPRIKELFKAIDFLHENYKWMHRCFETACRHSGPYPLTEFDRTVFK